MLVAHQNTSKWFFFPEFRHFFIIPPQPCPLSFSPSQLAKTIGSLHSYERGGHLPQSWGQRWQSDTRKTAVWSFDFEKIMSSWGKRVLCCEKTGLYSASKRFMTRNGWIIADGMELNTNSAERVVFGQLWEHYTGLFGEISSVQSGITDIKV